MSKELAKKMIISYYFTDRALRVGFKITLDSHHINHTKLTIKQNYLESGVETRYLKKNLKGKGYYLCRINKFIKI